MKFEPVSEKSVGDATEVMMKVSIPKPIEDAKSFILLMKVTLPVKKYQY